MKNLFKKLFKKKEVSTEIQSELKELNLYVCQSASKFIYLLFEDDKLQNYGRDSFIVENLGIKTSTLHARFSRQGITGEDGNICLYYDDSRIIIKVNISKAESLIFNGIEYNINII